VKLRQSFFLELFTDAPVAWPLALPAQRWGGVAMKTQRPEDETKIKHRKKPTG
jgi:hypothetical protein